MSSNSRYFFFGRQESLLLFRCTFFHVSNRYAGGSAVVSDRASRTWFAKRRTYNCFQKEIEHFTFDADFNVETLQTNIVYRVNYIMVIKDSLC